MPSGLKYFLRGCVFDAALLVAYAFWINSMQINKCGRVLAFTYEADCTFAGFLAYTLHFGGLVLVAAWWVTLPVLAAAPCIGLIWDYERMRDESGREGRAEWRKR